MRMNAKSIYFWKKKKNGSHVASAINRSFARFRFTSSQSLTTETQN